jgi:hypothetical protein
MDMARVRPVVATVQPECGRLQPRCDRLGAASCGNAGHASNNEGSLVVIMSARLFFFGFFCVLMVGSHHHILMVGPGDMAILKLFWFPGIVSIASILGLLQHCSNVAWVKNNNNLKNFTLFLK